MGISKELTEEDIKFRYINEAITSKGWSKDSIFMEQKVKFTDGKINAKSGYKGDISTYQISVPIQPGNSGGPLFDNSGTLVGITSSGLNKSITDNVNYAIKTKYLKLLIDEMTDKVELPKTTFPKTTLLTEKIKTLSNYVVCIK